MAENQIMQIDPFGFPVGYTERKELTVKEQIAEVRSRVDDLKGKLEEYSGEPWVVETDEESRIILSPERVAQEAEKKETDSPRMV